MSPRVVLCTNDESGAPNLPAIVTVDGHDVPIWSERHAVQIGDFAGWEYRHPALGYLVVAAVLAELGPNALIVAWVTSSMRAGDNPVFDQLETLLSREGRILGAWPVNNDLTVTQLDSDPSPSAAAVRAAWPAGWRLRMPDDARGSGLGETPYVAPAPPSGPRMLGISLG